MQMSRSNSSSMVGANPATINQTQQAQHNSVVSGMGKGTQDPYSSFRGNAHPPPSGNKRSSKYSNANRSPEAPMTDGSDGQPFKSSFAGAGSRSKLQ